MTFTYDLASGSAVSEVRFHINDVNPAAPIFSDEEIAARLSHHANSIGATVVELLEHLLARLSMPDFQADWLKVETSKAREGYASLLRLKRQRFGLAGLTGRTVIVTRTDV